MDLFFYFDYNFRLSKERNYSLGYIKSNRVGVTSFITAVSVF